MTIDINDDYKEWIENKIRSGEFKSPEEVVAAALDQLAADETDFVPGELEALLRPSIEQFERGEFISADEMDRQMKEFIRQSTASRRGA